MAADCGVIPRIGLLEEMRHRVAARADDELRAGWILRREAQDAELCVLGADINDGLLTGQ